MCACFNRRVTHLKASLLTYPRSKYQDWCPLFIIIITYTNIFRCHFTVWMKMMFWTKLSFTLIWLKWCFLSKQILQVHTRVNLLPFGTWFNYDCSYSQMLNAYKKMLCYLHLQIWLNQKIVHINLGFFLFFTITTYLITTNATKSWNFLINNEFWNNLEILSLWSAWGLGVAFDVLYTFNTVDLLKNSY